FYRLASFPIMLPPLRERREDIPVLVERFAAQAAHAHRKRVEGVTAEALGCLQRFDWPGNVRELQNEMQRAVVLAEHGEALGVEHLSPRLRGIVDATAQEPGVAGAAPATAGGALRGARGVVGPRHIADVLRQQGGNVSRAAGVLGLSRMQLHRKLKEY